MNSVMFPMSACLVLLSRRFIKMIQLFKSTEIVTKTGLDRAVGYNDSMF